MRKRDVLYNGVMMRTNLPGERLPGIPLIEISGECRVLVENHQGVIGYGMDEIEIKVTYGIVRIIGSNLQLACMTKHQLVIIGRIDSVALQHRGK